MQIGRNQTEHEMAMSKVAEAEQKCALAEAKAQEMEARLQEELSVAMDEVEKLKQVRWVKFKLLKLVCFLGESSGPKNSPRKLVPNFSSP